MTVGASGVSRRAHALTAAMSSSGGVVFNRNPDAPALKRFEDVVVDVEGRQHKHPCLSGYAQHLCGWS